MRTIARNEEVFQIWCHYSLYLKIDLIRLTPYHWQSNVSNFCDIRKERLCKISGKISNWRCLFCKIVCKVILFWCHAISKRRVTHTTESNGLNLFSRIRRIVKQGFDFGAPLYRVVSRAGLFGSSSGLKLTKFSGLFRAWNVLFVLSAQKYN